MTWLRAIAALLCLAGCKAHFEEQVQRHEVAHADVDTDEQTSTHVEDAPDKTTTTTEVLDDAGRVRKRRVQVKEHGAVVIDKHVDVKSQERGDSEVDEQHHTNRSFDFLHSPLMWIGLVVVAGGGIALVLKFRGIL